MRRPRLLPLGCRPLASVHVSTGQCYVFPLACGNTSTDQWTTTKRALFNGCSPLYSKYDLVNAKLLHAGRYAHVYYIARLLAQKSLRYGRLD